MSDSPRTIGQFIGSRAKNPDTSADPWTAAKSPLDPPLVGLSPSAPAIEPFQPAPTLRVPDPVHALEPAPGPSVRSPLPAEPAPPPSHRAPLPPPPDFKPAPNGRLPGPPPVAPVGPSILPAMPAPPLPSPPPAPTLVLVVRSQRAPQPAMPAPAPVAPARLPDMPAPANKRAPIAQPGPFVPPQFHRDATVQARLDAADKAIISVLSSIDDRGLYTPVPSGQGTHGLDPVLYGKSLSRLGSHLKANGLALFAATQFGLFLLNRHGKVWNPLTVSPPPLVGNFVPAALDVLTGTPPLITGYNDSKSGIAGDFYETNHGPTGEDIHLKLNRGLYNEVRIVHFPPFIQTVLGGGRSTLQRGLGSTLGAQSQLTSLVDDPIFGTDGSAGMPLVDAAMLIRNKYTPDLPYGDSAVVTADDLVDDALSFVSNPGKTGHLAAGGAGDLLAYQYRSTRGAKGASPIAGLVAAGARAFFGPRSQISAGEWRPDLEEKAILGKPMANRALFASAYMSKGTRGVVPARLPGENDHGFITTPGGQSPTTVLPDDVAYVPVSVTDLRPIDNSYRTVYFRPFNVKVRETFSPQWNKGQYFGRTDAVASYEATGRTFAIEFALVAFGPEDLKTIYQKLNWLTSMVYPEYDKNLLYLSGPVVRFRVGDVMNALGPEGCRGLPGIIEGMDFDYTEAPWELQDGIKVPQRLSVSISYLVLHDRPIGRGAEGKFGGLGTIRDGVFYAPGLDPSQGAGSDSAQKLPDADSNAFRSIKGIDLDGYGKFRDSKVPKANR